MAANICCFQETKKHCFCLFGQYVVSLQICFVWGSKGNKWSFFFLWSETKIICLLCFTFISFALKLKDNSYCTSSQGSYTYWGRIFKEFRNLESIPWSRFQLRNKFQVGIDSKGWSRVGTGQTLFHLGIGLDLIPAATRWKVDAKFKN